MTQETPIQKPTQAVVEEIDECLRAAQQGTENLDVSQRIEEAREELARIDKRDFKGENK